MIFNPFQLGNITTGDPTYDMSSAWKIFLNGADQSNWATATGLDGNDYFVEAEDVISNNIISINTAFYNPNQNIGFYTISDGLYMNGDEKASLNISMKSEVDVNGLSHKDGSFTLAFVYNYNGNTNDQNYKHWAGGRKGFKIEGGTGGINIADNLNTSIDNSGTASNGETFAFDPTDPSYSVSGSNPFFFCIQRDVNNSKYIIYTGELTGSATLADLKTHDTVLNSGWYVTNPFNNANDELEFLVDEDSILHAWAYNNTVVLESSIENTYLYMDQLFG